MLNIVVTYFYYELIISITVMQRQVIEVKLIIYFLNIIHKLKIIGIIDSLADLFANY